MTGGINQKFEMHCEWFRLGFTILYDGGTLMNSEIYIH